MIDKCGLCNKYKFNMHDEIHYTALDKKGSSEDFVMKICEDCANEIEKNNTKKDRGTDNRGTED
jgi:hypothetical protein